MRIETKNGEIDGATLFRIMWRGYFTGGTIIAIIIFCMAIIIMLSQLNNEYSIWRILLLPLLAPFVIAIQALLFSGISLLGLVIFPPKNR